MEGGYRKKLIKIVTFLAGIYFFLEFVLPAQTPAIAFLGIPAFKFGKYHDAISRGFITVGTMAIGLGIINLLMIHGSRIIFRRKQWINSAALLSGLVIMMTVATLDWFADLRISRNLQKISILSDFAKRIEKDHQDGKEGVPKLEFRNQKLLEASRAALPVVAPQAKEALGKLPAEGVDRTAAESYLKELELKLASCSSYLDHLEEDLSPSDFSVHQNLAASLGETAVLQGRILRLAHKQSTVNRLWKLLFEGLFVSLGSAMFSLLGIYIAAAAYRAFRIRSWESSLMMTAAIIVMLGQIPFGLWIYDGLPAIRQWLLECPNSAAFRAIKIGAAVAGLVMALRMWFSLESEYTAKEKE